jgi:hypothetical protein
MFWAAGPLQCRQAIQQETPPEGQRDAETMIDLVRNSWYAEAVDRSACPGWLS